MFDISWTEFLLIGIVALVVIGPKELPAVMRTVGQWTRKVRSMAADFQGQFQEAMREAEVADLKKEVDDVAQGIKDYDPLKEMRSEFESMGRGFENSLAEKPAGTAAAEPAPAGAPASVAATEAAELDVATASPHPPGEFPLPEAIAALGHSEVVGTGTGPVTPEHAVQPAPAEVPAGLGEEAERAGTNAVAAGIGPVGPDHTPRPEGVEASADPGKETKRDGTNAAAAAGIGPSATSSPAKPGGSDSAGHPG